MSPSSSSSAPPSTRPARAEAEHFRCPCGRSVAAEQGSDAAASGRCSSCRSRVRTEAQLRRST